MNLLDLPHHDGSARYVSHDAPRLGDVVTLWVRVPLATDAAAVYVRGNYDGEPRYHEAVVDRVVNGAAWWRTSIQLHNPVTSYRFLLDTSRGPRWLSARGVHAHDVPDATDFRLVADDPPPSWARDAVVYQIFPDRFARSTNASYRQVPDWAIPCGWASTVADTGPEAISQLFGGDLDGIAERLDHIVDLGATAIYLTPIFPARSNHRYDAAAFDQVDPVLGGNEALIRLSRAAHEQGLRLIGDLTTNHCGASHPWFQTARDDPSSAERDMFYFAGDEYESWMGVAALPKFNWGSGELHRRFAGEANGIARRWLAAPYELDGWRVDVANMTGRMGADAYTHEVAALLRAAVGRERDDALLVAEHFHDASSDLDRGGWHGTMNYAGFTRPVWTWLRDDNLALSSFHNAPVGVPKLGWSTAVRSMRAFSAMVSWRSLVHSWNLLGSHDTARIATVVGDRDRLEVAFGLQATLPGVPMIYAGDEIGLTGDNGEAGRKPMPWADRDGWCHDTHGRVRALTRLRHEVAALRTGGLRWAYADDDALAFVRETQYERILVYARRAAGDPVSLRGLGATNGDNLYGGEAMRAHPDGGVSMTGDGPTFQVWRLA